MLPFILLQQNLQLLQASVTEKVYNFDAFINVRGVGIERIGRMVFLEEFVSFTDCIKPFLEVCEQCELFVFRRLSDIDQ
ncbi:hypothetical protein D3C80_1276550 [compost metagenome]